MHCALIAGNGRFPLLVLEAALAAGHDMLVMAIKEETDPAIESFRAPCHWISLGELSRLIEILKREGVRQAVMAGQVKHARIFSSIRPDWRLAKVLLSLTTRNTDSLIGAVAQELAKEGIELLDSTSFLRPLLAPEGSLTARAASEGERADIAYGLSIARALAAFDIGQSVIICERACVAVEAMEGTDAALLRAAEFSNGRPLTVVKVAKPGQDLRFDVPVIGPRTIEAMGRAGATAISIDAARTLLLDRNELIRAADSAGIAIVGTPCPSA